MAAVSLTGGRRERRLHGAAIPAGFSAGPVRAGAEVPRSQRRKAVPRPPTVSACWTTLPRARVAHPAPGGAAGRLAPAIRLAKAVAASCRSPPTPRCSPQALGGPYGHRRSAAFVAASQVRLDRDQRRRARACSWGGVRVARAAGVRGARGGSGARERCAVDPDIGGDVDAVDLHSPQDALADEDWGGSRLTIVRDGGGDLVFDHGYFGRFALSGDGAVLRCQPRTGLPSWQWQRFLVGQLMPAAALVQGLGPMHCAAALIDGRAVLLLGTSGAGKTTTLLHLVEQGAAFLADDVAALERAGEGVVAHPGLRCAISMSDSWVGWPAWSRTRSASPRVRHVCWSRACTVSRSRSTRSGS